MKYSSIFAGLVCLTSLASASQAEPFCAAMLSEDTLERRYQRLAPIYNATDTGWMFGSNQFDNRYVLSATEESLLQQLVSELNARGTDLAILVAPPRPVVAGQEVFDATSGQPGAHDINQQAEAFHQMIGQIADAGAIAPNLLAMVQSDPQIQDAYYFRRDTHWTNLGSAHSALALAREIEPSSADAFEVSGLPVVEMVSERGSLSDIADATCGSRPAGEESPLFDYSGFAAQSVSLLGDETAPQGDVVLLGTSFSDRYGRDQYQTADALSAALGRTVENRSVSGGGMIGPFETYVLTGTYEAEAPDLIIWEFPYTYQLTESGLRQLLGAIRSTDVTPTATLLQPVGGDTVFDWTFGQDTPELLGVRLPDAEIRDMVLRLNLSDGSGVRVRVRRNRRVTEIAALTDWWIDLSGVDQAIQSIEFDFRRSDVPDGIELMLATSSG